MHSLLRDPLFVSFASIRHHLAFLNPARAGRPARYLRGLNRDESEIDGEGVGEREIKIEDP